MNFNYFDGKTTNLNNGLKVITIKRNTAIASINLGVKIGSLYEKDDERGISHFVEHMVFKGTNKRDNEKLNNDIEELGGEYNAYTDYGWTVYSFTALQEELNNMLDILSDMIINSSFDANELEKERTVVLAELNTSKDDVEDLSFQRLNKAAFNKSPLKHDVIGNLKTVKSFNKQKLLNFYKKYYIPNNSYISIVSNLEHEQVIALIENYFKDWYEKDLEMPTVICEANKPKKEITYKKDIEQCTILYLYTFHGLTKFEELTLRILNHKFGESTNSILFRKLREEEGLAYDVYSHLDMASNVKTLYIYTSVGEENLDKATNIIDQTILDIKNKKIIFDDYIIRLMKKVLKTAVAATLEDSTDLGSYALHQSLEDESIYGFKVDIEELNNINEEHLYSIANKVFNNPTIHILKAK